MDNVIDVMDYVLALNNNNNNNYNNHNNNFMNVPNNVYDNMVS